MSQESLTVDRRQNGWKQKDQCGKQNSSFPIRSSFSAHNILSDVCSPTKQARGRRPSAAGVWRTPLSPHPAPSVQPRRIDIPLTRAMTTQTSPQTTSMKQTFHHPDHHIYACPIPANKKPPQALFPWQQQQRTTSREEGLTPPKHVSFQDAPAQQRHNPEHCKDPEQQTDMWRRREAQDQLEKPKELCEMELLEQEVQRLQLKEEGTLEENVRLRRLSLEWQFQKRLQEIQKKGPNNEEEEEDENLDTLLMIQQLERKMQANGTHIVVSCYTKSHFVSEIVAHACFFFLQMVRSSAANVNTDPRMAEMGSRPQTADSRAKTGN